MEQTQNFYDELSARYHVDVLDEPMDFMCIFLSGVTSDKDGPDQNLATSCLDAFRESLWHWCKTAIIPP
jgi:hypothetical protein